MVNPLNLIKYLLNQCFLSKRIKSDYYQILFIKFLLLLEKLCVLAILLDPYQRTLREKIYQ